MIPRLLNANVTDFTQVGIPLTDTEYCKVKEERNGVFELELRVATTTPYFEELEVGKIIVAKPNHDQGLQAFEIYEITRPILQRVTVRANHISYRTSFIPVKPFSCTGITETLNGLISNSMETNPFTFNTTITNEQSSYNQTAPASLRSRLGGTEGSVLDVFGGEYKWDNFTINLLLHRGQDNGVELRVGKNISDLEQTANMENIVTGALPYWSNEDETEFFYGDVQYSSAVSDYDYKRTVVLDLSDQFETAPTSSQLNSAAVEYLSQTNLGIPNKNIKLSFVDLADTDEYKDSPLERVNLCDIVSVIYTPLNINYNAKVISLTFDVLAERTLEVEVGDSKSTISKTITDLVGDVSSVIKTGKKLVSVTQKIDRELGEVRTTVASVQQTVDGSLNHITYLYAYGDSATTKPSDSAFTYSTMPPLVDGKYIWRMSLAYTNENPSSNPTKTYEMIQGATGQTGSQGERGEKGDTGSAGNGIASITYYYATSTTQTQPSASSITSTTIPTLSETNKYLWQKEVIKYTEIADKVTVSLIAVYGDRGSQGQQGETGATGNGISSITYYYKATTTQTAPSASSVTSTSIPTLSETNKYLWQKQHIAYTDGTSKDTVALIAVYGDKGDDGVSVTQIDNLYYLKDALLDISLNGNTTQGANPSPSSPQAIHSVSGDNEIRVVGKNLMLFNKANQSNTSNGVTCSWDATTQTFSLSGTNTATSNYVVLAPNVSGAIFPPFKSGETYTISADNMPRGVYIQINYKVSNTLKALVNLMSTGTRIAQTFTVPSDYTSVSTVFIGINVKTVGTLSTSDMVVQLEQGSTATTYEPYKAQVYPINLGSIELNALGDYKDYFYKNDGKWYLHKAIDKVDMGTLTWTANNHASLGLYFYSNVTSLGFAKQADYTSAFNALCANYVATGRSKTAFKDNMFCFDGSSTQVTQAQFKDGRFTTASDFKSAVNGVYLYAPLATPTNTEITDETLISQLNALQRAMSYDGGTSILQTNSDNPFAITYETSALTRPNKPTEEVTSMSTLPEVWSLQTADYISGYRFYTCLQIHYDNNTLTWTDVVEDKSLQDVREKIVTMSTDIIQNTEAINLKADSSTVEQGFNDMGDRIAQTEQANADLQVRANSISSSVSETRTLLETNYATKSELTNSANSLSTTIQQTAQDIQVTISDVQDVISSQGQQITTLETYIRATSRGLEISRSSDEVTMVLSNTELGFYNKANTKLAWLDSADGLGASALSIGDANTASNRWRVFTRENGSHLTFTRHS